MKEKKTLEQRLQELGATNVAELWDNSEVDPVELVRLDPLEISYEIVRRAENPQYGYECVRIIPPFKPRRVTWLPL